ncbi:hypothetical protein D9M71_517520 [compost metagenome]
MSKLKNVSGRKASKPTHIIEDARVIDGHKKGGGSLWRKIPAGLKELAKLVIRYGVSSALNRVWENREEILSVLLEIVS